MLLAAGYQTESIPLFATHFTTRYFGILPAFGNAYGRFSVKDNLCGISHGRGRCRRQARALPRRPRSRRRSAPATASRRLRASQLINNDSVGGPINYALAVSPSTGVQDFSLDGGAVPPQPVDRHRPRSAGRAGRRRARPCASGNLRGKPAIIVHGRADTLIPRELQRRGRTSALNKQVEGAQSKLTYIEVTNAQHFDAFIDNAALPGLRLGLRPAPLLLHPGDGRDVRAPHRERTAAVVAGRAHDAARRHARRRRRRSPSPTCRRLQARRPRPMRSRSPGNTVTIPD